MSIKVSVKQSGVGETFDIEVTNEQTVADVKATIAGVKEGLELSRITLVYKGRILKDV